MKKSLIITGLFIGSVSLQAMDTNYFIGAGAERGKLNVKSSVKVPMFNIENNISDDLFDTSLKLKAGVILDKTHRISLSHVKYEELDSDLSLILANYDYLISINEQFRLYSGLHLGNARVNISTDSFGDYKKSGLAYGFQIGTLYDITKHIELELGLNYTLYNVDKNVSGLTMGIPYEAYGELKKSKSMFLGLNYKF